MLLKKIFKPKWQSSNPEVRKEAVSQLDWSAQEDRSTLKQLLHQEQHPQVLETAINRVLSLKDIIQLAEDGTERVKPLAVEKLIILLRDSSQSMESLLQEQFAELSESLVFALLTALKDSPARQQLLSGIYRHAPSRILKVATHHPISQVRLAAASEVKDAENLSQLASSAKGRDKGVYQLARTRLQEFRDQEQEQRDRQQQVTTLLENLAQLASTEVMTQYVEKVEVLGQKYDRLHPHIDSTLQSKAAEQLAICRQRAAELLDTQRRESEAKQEAEQQRQERAATCEQLESTRQQLKQQPMTQQGELSALDALVKTQENRWLEATRHQTVEKAEQKRYQNVMGEIRHYHLALQRLLSMQADLTRQLDELGDTLAADKNSAGFEQLRQAVQQIEWPADYALPPLLQRIQETVGQIETQQVKQREDISKLKTQINTGLSEMSAAIDAGSLKKAQRLSKEINALIDQLSGKSKHDFQNLHKTQLARLAELRDWQGFATRPKQEELCEYMEQLAEQPMEPHVKAEKIRELQKDWRELGGSSDQKLWQRFKEASDKAYAPCRDLFNEEDKLKQANLAKRQSIVEELNAFLEATDWSAPDWKLVDRINRKAREEWRQYHPVDHRRGKAVQSRFNRLLQQLDEYLRAEKERNHALKREIVDAAAQLTGETDIRKATQGAKELQKKWQSAGITDHRTDRQLWNEFRKHCDQIFNRLGEQRRVAEEELLEHQKEAEALIAQVTEVGAQNTSIMVDELANLTEKFRGLGPLGDRSKELTQQFHKVVEDAEGRLQQRLSEQHLETLESLLDKAQELRRLAAQSSLPDEPELLTGDLDKHYARALERAIEHFRNADLIPEEQLLDLVIHGEILAGIDSPDADRQRRMALQVERLNSGLQQKQPAGSKADQVRRLLTQWLEAAVSGEPERMSELNQRFQLALQSMIIADRLSL